MADTAILSDPPTRDIVVGKNSAVWRMLRTNPSVVRRVQHVIGHRDLNGFPFHNTDRVWILSYSRDPLENESLLDQLKSAGIRRVIYFSSATTNVTGVTSCYEYPRVKAAAAAYAQRELAATIVLLGFVYGSPDDVPAGTCAAVSIEELANFICNPDTAGQSQTLCLFRMVHRPFGSSVEQMAYRVYDRSQRAAGSFPCILRPIDLLLRAIGWRWYGYLNLSNRIWSLTKS